MSFHSFNFILSLPFFVLSFWLLPKAFQKGWLLVLSLVVYWAAGPADFLLLLWVVFLNWASQVNGFQPRRVAGVMVALNLAMLVWFKYRLFLGDMAGFSVARDLIIPLGISFYIFQLIAYQVEVARGQISGRQSFWEVLLYIFFFPHHQAGPIMRPRSFLICFHKARNFYRSRFLTGLMIFAWGLFKKVWIADVVAPWVNRDFGKFHLWSGAKGNLLLLGVLFGIQVYGDFSGYSDMAVGMGRMFGFKFDRNFHQPYLSKNPSEFWKRWHVTLTNWMRDFVYFPMWNWASRHLGHRFKPGAIMLGCSLVLMLVTGLWHGAGWHFILWGGLHGLIFIAWRLLPSLQNRSFKLISFFLFQTVIGLTWVVFREADIQAIGRAFLRSSAWDGQDSLLALGLLLALILFSRAEEWLERRFVRLTVWAMHLPMPLFATAYGSMLIFIFIGAGSATTFIYQRF
ncbi:MAG: MBOAT family protein [Holophagaceae bacterium]|nr:MBOAT family protein [Holophagaceae bacterium]